MPVPLVCPVCGKKFEAESIEKLLEDVRKAWGQWRPLPPAIEAKIAEYNNMKSLQEALKKDGHITMFCKDCAFAATVHLMIQMSARGVADG